MLYLAETTVEVEDDATVCLTCLQCFRVDVLVWLEVNRKDETQQGTRILNLTGWTVLPSVRHTYRFTHKTNQSSWHNQNTLQLTCCMIQEENSECNPKQGAISFLPNETLWLWSGGAHSKSEACMCVFSVLLWFNCGCLGWSSHGRTWPNVATVKRQMAGGNHAQAHVAISAPALHCCSQ